MPLPVDPLRDDDLPVLTRQLGRRPRGVLGVARRCDAGHPCVVLTYPLRRTRDALAPFPTLLWLTCPALCRRLAQLEEAGEVRRVEAELRRDSALADRLRLDHWRCVVERWAQLSAEDRRAVLDRGLLAHFRQRGIGGLRNPRAVKCLHLHYAHHLVIGNAIGDLLQRRHGLRPCCA